MARFKNTFRIEKQVTPYSCISAAACSLIAALGHIPVDQMALHRLISPEDPPEGRSGFQQLATVLPTIGEARATAYSPESAHLREWIEQMGENHQGMLVSLHAFPGAHIVVLYKNDNGAWQKADPDTARESAVCWDEIVSEYAGDIAIVE